MPLMEVSETERRALVQQRQQAHFEALQMKLAKNFAIASLEHQATVISRLAALVEDFFVPAP